MDDLDDAIDNPMDANEAQVLVPSMGSTGGRMSGVIKRAMGSSSVRFVDILTC